MFFYRFVSYKREEIGFENSRIVIELKWTKRNELTEEGRIWKKGYDLYSDLHCLVIDH